MKTGAAILLGLLVLLALWHFWDRDPSISVANPGDATDTTIPPAPVEAPIDRSPVKSQSALEIDVDAARDTATLDLGDITMQSGSAVYGSVVDTQGNPQPGVRIRLGKERPTDAETLHPRMAHSATSDEEGQFRFPSIPAGVTNLRLSYAILRAPKVIDVPARTGDHYVQIVVESAEDWPSLRGVVVDETGRSVAGVRVSARTLSNSFGNRPTSADGQFTIMRRPRRPPIPEGRVQLHANGLGFEPFVSKEEYPWGTKDIRVALTRLAGLDLWVSDGTNAITDYSIYIAKAPKSEVQVQLPFAAQNSPGPHEKGHTRVAGLLRGNFLLKVLPTDSAWAESSFQPIRFEKGPDQHIDVVLKPAVVQPVLVRFANDGGSRGPGIPGARIELLESMDGKPIATRSKSFHIRRGIWKPTTNGVWISGRQPYRWQLAWTDGQGAAELRGPRDLALALRVTGPGFLTVIRERVTLVHGGDPIVIEVTAGAMVTGRIRPLEFVRQLHDMAKQAPRMHPGITLRRGRERFPTRSSESIEIAKDGSFEVRDVPTGTWELRLAYVQVRGGGTSMKSIPIRELGKLRPSETRHLDLDLSHLMFSTVEGTIYVDDQPVPRGSLRLRDGKTSHNIRADAKGHFRDLVPPGRYKAEIFARLPLDLPADETIYLRPGRKVTQDVHSHTVHVTFRAKDAAGNAIAGIRLKVTCESMMDNDPLDPTNAKGEVSARLPRLRVFVSARPKGTGRRAKTLKLLDCNLRQGTGPRIIPVELPTALGY